VQSSESNHRPGRDDAGGDDSEKEVLPRNNYEDDGDNDDDNETRIAISTMLVGFEGNIS
jgi:hypothetical protein